VLPRLELIIETPLTAAMVKGFQGISLISIPDVLHRNAVPARAKTPYNWLRENFCFIEDLKKNNKSQSIFLNLKHEY